MATHVIFRKCCNLASIPTAGVATPPPQQESCCPYRSSSILRFQLRSTRSLDQFYYSPHKSRKRNREAPGKCGTLAVKSGGHLSLLSSTEIADQNERLKDAAKAGDLQSLNEILGMSEVNIDLPSSSRAGWTALHLACFYDHPEVVTSLLKAGANVDVRNESGNTALQLASIRGNVDIAQILLESGADIYAESADKGTALDYAQEWGGEEIVDFLLLWAARSSQT